MRKAPTRAENRLWLSLRDRRCSGFKFKRQVPIGRYIVDFYCADLRLVVELDGSHHGAPWMSGYESDRTTYLSGEGITVLRIPNELLIRDALLVGQQMRR